MTRISLGGAVLRGVVSTALMVSLMSASALGGPPVDLSKWSPEYVRSIAGTQDFDTAGDCAKVTPLDYKGRLTFWYQGVFEGDPDLLRQYYKEFFETFRKTYPNIQLEEQALTYNDLLDKFRTALLGNAAPMAVRLQILGGTEFASKGYLQPLKPEDVGYSTEDFWPGAMKAVTWEGVTYGIPTNNETMAFIWNKDIFQKAGLPTDWQPNNWADILIKGGVITGREFSQVIAIGQVNVTILSPAHHEVSRLRGSVLHIGQDHRAARTKILVVGRLRDGIRHRPIIGHARRAADI